ncbi:hypothetical protein NKH77_48185 [Streptomyces sp. M19]
MSAEERQPVSVHQVTAAPTPEKTTKKKKRGFLRKLGIFVLILVIIFLFIVVLVIWLLVRLVRRLLGRDDS